MPINLSELSQGLKDRIRHPIIAGFILSWLGLNWKFLLFMIYAPLDIEKKFTKADEDYLNWYRGLVGPLLISAIMVIVLPYISEFLSQLTYSAQKRSRMNKIQADIDIVEKKHELTLKTQSLKDHNELANSLEQSEQSVRQKQIILAKVDSEISKEIDFLKLLDVISSTFTTVHPPRENDNNIRSFVEHQFDEIAEFLGKYNAAVVDERRREDFEKYVENRDRLINDLQTNKLIEQNGQRAWKWSINPNLWSHMHDALRRKINDRIRDFYATEYRSRREANNL